MEELQKVRVAFYRGSRDEWNHRFIRWWTKSDFSHAELVLPGGETWVSISPFIFSRVSAKVVVNPRHEDWVYVDLWVTESRVRALKEFISETTGDRYDWVGMLLSQVLPFIVKGKGRWYCSSWIAHALSHAGIVKWKRLGIYEFPDLHPGRLHEILVRSVELPKDDTSESQQLPH